MTNGREPHRRRSTGRDVATSARLQAFAAALESKGESGAAHAELIPAALDVLELARELNGTCSAWREAAGGFVRPTPGDELTPAALRAYLCRQRSELVALRAEVRRLSGPESTGERREGRR